MTTPSSLSENKKFHYEQYTQLRTKIEHSYQIVIAGQSFLAFCSMKDASDMLLRPSYRTRYGLPWFITVSLFALLYVTRDGLHPIVMEKRDYHRCMAEEYDHSLSTLVNRD